MLEQMLVLANRANHMAWAAAVMQETFIRARWGPCIGYQMMQTGEGWALGGRVFCCDMMSSKLL